MFWKGKDDVVEPVIGDHQVLCVVTPYDINETLLEGWKVLEMKPCDGKMWFLIEYVGPVKRTPHKKGSP